MSGNGCTLRGNRLFVFMSIFFLILAVFGARSLVGLFSSGNAAEITVSCFFETITVIIAILVLSQGVKTVTADETGIHSKGIIMSRTIPWSELCDCGITYTGQSKNGWSRNNAYVLYFSRKILKVNRNSQKSLDGRIIKLNIIGDDYELAVNDFLPYCRARIAFEPFVAEKQSVRK